MGKPDARNFRGEGGNQAWPRNATLRVPKGRSNGDQSLQPQAPPFHPVPSHVPVVHCRRGGEPLSPAPGTLDRATAQSGTMSRTPLGGGNIMRFDRITCAPRVMDGVRWISGPRPFLATTAAHAVRPHGIWSAERLFDPDHNCAASRVACDAMAVAVIHSRRWVSIP